MYIRIKRDTANNNELNVWSKKPTGSQGIWELSLTVEAKTKET